MPLLEENNNKLNEKFSLHSLFERSVEKYADKPCMALSRYTSYPPKQRNVEPKFDPIYEYQTYKQVGDLVNNIAASLIAFNLEKTPCDEGEEPRVKVGFWCSTSFEMRVAMMACHKAGFVVVPVYETLSHENVISIFEL
ncbi:MAG: Long-chain-fatty-acid--CoA ligase 4, partial [Paramarteilia canceri]